MKCLLTETINLIDYIDHVPLDHVPDPINIYEMQNINNLEPVILVNTIKRNTVVLVVVVRVVVIVVVVQGVRIDREVGRTGVRRSLLKSLSRDPHKNVETAHIIGFCVDRKSATSTGSRTS